MINLADLAAYTVALGIAAAIHRSAAVAMAGAAGTMIMRDG